MAALDDHQAAAHWPTIPSCLARLTGAQDDSNKTQVEFVQMSSPGWPLGPTAAVGLTPAEWRRTRRRPIRISVLDSSFNPPTRAHLALASSPPRKSPSASNSFRQAPTLHMSSGSTTTETEPSQASEGITYDAHMLLLSVTNADKELKAGDATYQQRLEMMTLLAGEMGKASKAKESLCVAAIDEPTFVGKSRKLRRAVARQLSSLSDPEYSPRVGSSEVETLGEESIRADWEREVNIYFVLGFDTVTRLFDPRFYGSIEAMRKSLRLFFAPTSEGGDGSYVVCARRNATAAPTPQVGKDTPESKGVSDSRGTCGYSALRMNQEEQSFFRSLEVKEYWENGKVSLMEDMESELQSMSSTPARIANATTPGGRDAELRRLLPSSVVKYVLQQGLYTKA